MISVMRSHLLLGILFCLLLIYNLASAGVPLYVELQSDVNQSAAVITEIKVQGLKTLDPAIILAQLPFRVGDRWDAAAAYFGVQRLRLLGILDDYLDPPKITAVPVSPGKVSVTVSVMELSHIARNPMEFTVGVLTNLATDSCIQMVYNINRQGLCLGGGYAWGDARYYYLSGMQPVVAEKGGVVSAAIITGEANSSLNTGPFQGSWYHQNVNQAQVVYTVMNNPQFRTSLGIGYSRYDFSSTIFRGGLNLSAQRYLFGSYLVRTPSYFAPGLALTTGIWGGYDLGESSPSYLGVSGLLEWRGRSQPWGMYSRLGVGKMTEETPVNRQFSLGGFTTIPLRGSLNNYYGDEYLQSTLEFRCRLRRELAVFTFADTGRTWAHGQVTSGAHLPYTIGAGARVSLPIWVPTLITWGYEPATKNNAFDCSFSIDW